MKKMNIFSACGILGYGFPKASLEEGLRRKPDIIGCDGGSTDPGPYYLGSGNPFVSRGSCKRDARLLLNAALEHKIPFIVGSAGGGGGRDGLNWLKDIILEIAKEDNLHFKLALIDSEQDKNYLKNKLSDGKIKPLDHFEDLTEDDIDECEHIVGMMGAEPIIKALKDGADVVITGRSSDTSIFAALPLLKGFPEGLTWHAAKILECGAHSADIAAGGDSIMVTLKEDCFEVEPMNPELKHTVVSTAAHSMYENASPFMLYEPSGILDLSSVSYEQITNRRVRVKGSKFIPAKKYAVKLEGAKKVGYRTITICGTHDPILIKQIDDYIERVKKSVKNKVQEAFGDRITENDYILNFRQYGRNAIMGELEPNDILPQELGIVVEVIAKDPEISKAILAFARTFSLHNGFPGRVCTGGNMAMAFSPSDIYLGPTYQFCINHIVEVEDPLEMFSYQLISI